MWESDSNFRPRSYVKLIKLQGSSHLDLSIKCQAAMSFALHWTTRGFLCGGKHLGCALCKVRGVRMMAYLATKADRTIGIVEVGAATLEQIQAIADENNAGHLNGLRLRLRRSSRSQRLEAEYHGVAVVTPREIVSELELLESVARLYQLPALEPAEFFGSYSKRLQEEVLALAQSQAAMLTAGYTTSTR